MPRSNYPALSPYYPGVSLKNLEAEVGIVPETLLFGDRMAHVYWLHKRTLSVLRHCPNVLGWCPFWCPLSQQEIALTKF